MFGRLFQSRGVVDNAAFGYALNKPAAANDLTSRRKQGNSNNGHDHGSSKSVVIATNKTM